MTRSLFRQKTTDTKLSGVENAITQWSRPTYLRADSNDELKIEVDIWYNVMYLNKDQNGNDLRTTEEIEPEKKRLLERVGHISDWDVSRVTNMEGLFKNLRVFNENLNNWNVSNVTNMSSIFYGLINFNRSLKDWNVSNVSNMSSMFFHNLSFNKPLENWNVSNVTSMNGMFYRATMFNQPLNSWNVSNVTSMRSMLLMQ